MEQITLVFLIGAFVLFLIQMKYPKQYPIKVMGFFASVSVIALSLSDAQLMDNPGGMAVMLASGFAFALYTIIGMLKEV